MEKDLIPSFNFDDMINQGYNLSTWKKLGLGVDPEEVKRQYGDYLPPSLMYILKSFNLRDINHKTGQYPIRVQDSGKFMPFDFQKYAQALDDIKKFLGDNYLHMDWREHLPPSFVKFLENTTEHSRNQEDEETGSVQHSIENLKGMLLNIKKKGFLAKYPILMSNEGVAFGGAHRLGILAHLLKNNYINPDSNITVLETPVGMGYNADKYRPNENEIYKYDHPNFKTFADFLKQDKEFMKKRKDEDNRRKVQEAVNNLSGLIPDPWINRTPINMDRDDQQPRIGNLFFH
jgi:hypothetical protein